MKKSPHATPDPAALYTPPKAHLAIYCAMQILFPDVRWPDKLQLITSNRPDIAKRYKAKTGRALTADVVVDCVDTASLMLAVGWGADLAVMIAAAIAKIDGWGLQYDAACRARRERWLQRSAACRARTAAGGR